MRVAGGVLVVVLLVAGLRTTSARKLDSDAEETDDSSFGFLTTTLSSLTNLFSSDDDKTDDIILEEKERVVEEKERVVEDEKEMLNEVLKNEEEDSEEFSEEGVGTDDVDQAPADDPSAAVLTDKEKEEKEKAEKEEKEKAEKEKAEKEKAEKEKLEDKLEKLEKEEEEILDKLEKEENEEEKEEEENVQPETIPPRRPSNLGNMMENSRNVGSSNTLPNTSMVLMSDRRYYQPALPSLSSLDQHMRTCDNCLVSWDSFQCPLNDMAIELKKWITELEEVLSFGCQLGDGCAGQRKCCHRRDPVFEKALTDMTSMARQMYNSFQSSCTSCPRDGGWSEWCEWGACSVTCGPGTRRRTRQCNNPSPKGGGRQCPGMPMETIPCSGGDCCIPQNGNWGSWTPWSMCSATCGRGTRDRQRTCSSPPPNECGRTCFGSARDTESCERTSCCVDGNWGQWERWTQCSATCGSGMRERRRRCDSPRANYCGQTCPGPDMNSEPCNTTPCAPLCVNGNWGPWQPWSRCSATCGSGLQSRMRRCDNPSPNYCGRRCPGTASDTQSCRSNIDCCVNGNWGQWEPWSECSASCDRGNRERRRQCNSPSPNFCGSTCPGQGVESDRCEDRPCPIVCIPMDGNWSPWTMWTACSATCGQGSKQRSRTCSSPPPNSCGRTCPGPSFDTGMCDSGPCCVDGNWGPWERWSTPSASCGMATKERRRRCDSPRPNYCGRQCPGLDSEQSSYFTGIPCQPICEDGNWSPWSMWSSCSVSCGQGVRDRSRSCSNPPPNQCGRTCPGSPRDTDRCDEGPCCVNGNWGQWERWTVPVTCGVGMRNRRRRCDNPSPNICGRTCPGPAYENDPSYDTGIPCRVCEDGNWSLWSPWSQCSTTCGPGSRDRSRSCSNPPPNECGRTCPGRARDSDRCDLGPCCIPQNGNWAPWSQWTQCTVSCGRGTRERSRTCSNPPANRCGRTCPGSARDTDICDQGECCVHGNWGPWERWSTPSVTCGTASRERRRRCDSPRPNLCGRQCPGPDTDRESYDTGVPCQTCIDGNWSPWSRWTPCSTTCGTGMQDRERTCSNPAPNICGRTCMGPAKDMRRCDQGPCCIPRDGDWGPWTPWSQCSATCGQGSRDRTRTCNNPRPNECGRTCPGTPRDTERCDGGDCCVHGNWGLWGQWSSSVTCDSGMRERRRRCDSPRANYCGRPCPGPDVDNEMYDTGRPCRVCIDGNWGSWERWSTPAVTCGETTRERRRRCNNPSANFCGRSCPGLDLDTERYDTGVPCQVCVDGNWGPWERWGIPSVTCGTGTRQRRRRCDNPRANFCGRACPGPDMDSESYATGVPCVVCIDGNWSPWGAWSPCPVTCGSALRDRRRSCDSPSPNQCGQTCPGSAFESALQRCGPDGGEGFWGQWTSWGACSRTCGRGQQYRSRRCDASSCELPCPGPNSDTRSCDEGPCCVDRQWSQWNPWSRCDATCGQGRRTRRRSCDSVGFGQDCGNQCPGRAEEVDSCYGLPPCETPWGPWSSCSATCEGFGTRERRRMSSGTVILVGTQTEQESCQVFSPPCPQPASWTPWANWCPCDCKKGVRSRRRTCEQMGRFGQGSPVDISNCGAGAAREEEYCDVRQACPVCVSDCLGRLDGQYPSCSSCNDYVNCENGRLNIVQCNNNNYEYDAFIRKCVAPPSPSCALKECASSCIGRADGRYPSCFGCESFVQCEGGRDREQSCPAGQEFNAHLGQCGAGRSPTCIRAILRRVDIMIQDAPADSYFQADGLEDEARKELYMELREKAGVAAKFNRTDEDVFREEEKKAEEEKAAREKEAEALKEKIEEEIDEEEEEEEEEEENEKDKDEAVVIEKDEKDKKVTDDNLSVSKPEKPKKKGDFLCKQDCSKVKAGFYQSCKGCSYYLMCTKHGIARELKCREGRFWDDKKKKCRKHSRTCMPRDFNNTKL